MILDNCYSSIGRTTHQHLNNLRRQLGTGVDPAYDYSAMNDLQKKLAMAGKQGLKARSEKAHGEGSASPTSGLDLLKRTLKEVVGTGAGIDDGDSEQADASAHNRRARSTPADTKDQREQNRNTSAFKNSTRESLSRLDIENRFRAPPIGSYRPKDEIMQRKQVCHEWTPKRQSESLKTTELNKEIQRLEEEGQPVEHLTKPAVTIELQEGIPDRPKSKGRNYQMVKDLPRPDMAVGKYYDNSFTAGVLDGKERTSDYPRLPSWDFAKTSTAPDKPREYFFQPGQYAVKWEVSRPKLDVKNISFDNQQARKPLRETVGGKEVASRPTMHLPDRSLSRPSALGAVIGDGRGCQVVEARVKDVHIAKCTTRKPPYEYVPPVYDASDPEVVEAVMHRHNTFDLFEAIKATKTRLQPAREFGKDLTRMQQLKTTRSFGNDIALTMMQNSLAQGPTSSELAPMDAIHDKPSLQKKVLGQSLKTMAGREQSKSYMELPPRGKVDELCQNMSFERGSRSGDARAETQIMSRLAGAITELRGARSYDALPREDHPAPSVEFVN